jgi:phospholipid/cholesterol/gamma-HCH transport system permease protein
MRVTEQIDALEVMATDPVHYLWCPRVGGHAHAAPAHRPSRTRWHRRRYVVSVLLFGANPVTYLDNTFQYMDLEDLDLGPPQGRRLRHAGGGGGVHAGLLHDGRGGGCGPRHHRAVVVASITILICDFFLTKLLF